MNQLVFGARLLRAILRGAGIVVMTIVLTVPAVIAVAATGRCPAILPRLWHRGACALTGIRVNRIGEEDLAGNSVLVANHVSYLDIMAIGAWTDTVFVARGDVAGWPVIGPLSRLIGTVFVSRSPARAGQERDRVLAALRRHRCLCFFPEGTSSDGRTVLPFRSALFDAVLESGAAIQPVTLAWRDGEAAYAWYGDMSLLPHLGRVLMRSGVRIDLIRHPAVASGAFADRRALARHAENAVRSGLSAAPSDAEEELLTVMALPLIENAFSRAQAET